MAQGRDANNACFSRQHKSGAVSQRRLGVTAACCNTACKAAAHAEAGSANGPWLASNKPCAPAGSTWSRYAARPAAAHQAAFRPALLQADAEPVRGRLHKQQLARLTPRGATAHIAPQPRRWPGKPPALLRGQRQFHERPWSNTNRSYEHTPETAATVNIHAWNIA